MATTLANISVVIPVHGRADLVHICLESLKLCSDFIREVIIVDNASPDNAPEIAGRFSFVKLIRNSKNLGFSAACNQGFQQSAGEFILFLNSDTVLLPEALAEMLLSVRRNPQIGAVGPRSNYAGYSQGIATDYKTLGELPDFVKSFCARPELDFETDILVGVCILARKSVLLEVGLFDIRFGLGQWEDNDLSYRMLRKGYQLVVANRSYVHHFGSQTMNIVANDFSALYKVNEAFFAGKWRTDVASGFTTALSGLGAVHLQEPKWTPSHANMAYTDNTSVPELATAICCTFGRPLLLCEAIQSFLDQDYEPKELLIINDQAEMVIDLDDTYPNITILNLSSRFRSLGEKRNFANALSLGSYCFIWDDDDLSFPWRMSQSIRYLKQHPDAAGVKAPSSLFSLNNSEYGIAEGPLHGQICYRGGEMRRCSYRADMSNGEDQEFEKILPPNLVNVEPFFWLLCRWGLGIYHISGAGTSISQEENWERARASVRSINLPEVVRLTPGYTNNHWRDCAKFLETICKKDELQDWILLMGKILTASPRARVEAVSI